MILGRVNEHLEPVVSITVIAPDRRITVDAVVDTAFDGHIVLPPKMIESLDLPYRGQRLAMLGNDVVAEFDVYRASVIWDQNEVVVSVMAGGEDPLLGTQLLKSHELSIDFVVDGEVAIRELLESP